MGGRGSKGSKLNKSSENGENGENGETSHCNDEVFPREGSKKGSRIGSLIRRSPRDDDDKPNSNTYFVHELTKSSGWNKCCYCSSDALFAMQTTEFMINICKRHKKVYKEKHSEITFKNCSFPCDKCDG